MDVFDERVPSALVYVTLDLNKMGLPTGVPYTVEDTNLATGEFRHVPGTDRADVTADDRARSPPPSRLSVSRFRTRRRSPCAKARERTRAHRTPIIETFDQAAIHGAEDRMNVSNDGNRTVLIRFDLSNVPSAIAIKAAQLKVYAHYKWGSATTLGVSVHGLLGGWNASEANWLQPSDGAILGQAWSLGGRPGLRMDCCFSRRDE